MSQDNQKIQLTLNWLKDPLTRGYVDFLKTKEQYYKEAVAKIVEHAIMSGSKERTDNEVSVFNQVKYYRECLEDLLPYFEIAHKEEELTEEDYKNLIGFFETLTKK